MASKGPKFFLRLLSKKRRQRAAYLSVAFLVIFSIFTYDIFFSAQKVKAATVGSSSDVNPIGDSTQKSSVVTSNGAIVAFYDSGTQSPTGIVYSMSSDNGATWSAATQVTSTQTDDFSVAIDSSNNIYIVWSDSTFSIISKKLTYSGGTWTIGADVSVYVGTPCGSQSEGDEMFKPILRATPTGLALAFFQRYEIQCQGPGNYFFNFATSDFNLTWGIQNAGSFDSSAAAGGTIASNLVIDGKIIWFYLGNDLYYTIDGTSYNKVPNTTINGDLSNDPVMCYGLDQLNLLYRNTSGNIAYRSYNIATGSLSSETTISSNAGDIVGTLVCDSYNIWAAYDSFVALSSYNIVYKRFNGSAWDSSATSITTDNLNNGNINSPARALNSSVVPVLWRTGTASPYTVKAATLSAASGVTDTGNQTGSLTGALTGSSGDVIVKCGVWYYDTVNIVAGMTIKVCPSNGARGGSLEIHANSVTIAGTIDGAGRGSPGGVNIVGSGGAGGTGGTTSGNDVVGSNGTAGQPGPSSDGIAGSGTYGSVGGAAGSNGSGGAGGAASTDTSALGMGRPGGGGGGGTNGSSASTAGGYLAAGVNGDSSTDESLAQGSGGGAGGTGGSGGGGGGGGPGFSTTSTGFSACPDGGNGGNGGAGGAGGKGGNGGAIVKIYSAGTLSVTGTIVTTGQAGSSGGSGSNGSNGTAGASGTC